MDIDHLVDTHTPVLTFKGDDDHGRQNISSTYVPLRL
jgi:hypothetical protein